MVNLQPYDFQKKTNIKEHNDIVDKTNEIVEVINNSDLENVGADITALEGQIATLNNTVESQGTAISNNTNDISTIETEITGIKSKDSEQDGKIVTLESSVSSQGAVIGTLETTVSSQGTRIGTLETSQSSQDSKITALESSQSSQDSKISALETSQGTQDNKITAIENIQGTLAIASTLSTTEHTDTEKIGISIDSQDGQTNKVAYIPIATPSSIGLMSATDKSNLNNLVSNPPITEIPIATSTVLGGIKVGANLSITEDGTLSATGGGGTGADLPLHTVGSNDESVLVQVDPVITNGNVILRTTYKDYKNDGTITQKQDDSTYFPTATTDRPGMMSTADKTKLDSVPNPTTIALKSEIPDTSQLATKTEVQTIQTNLSDFEAELISDPSALVGLASTAHAGLMSSQDKAKADLVDISGGNYDLGTTKLEIATDSSAIIIGPNRIEFTNRSESDAITYKNGNFAVAGGAAHLVVSGELNQYATNDDLSDVQNQITNLKLSESGANGIMLNGDTVNAVRSVAGSVTGSNLTVNVNGVASQPIALPSGGGGSIFNEQFNDNLIFFDLINSFISDHTPNETYSVTICFSGSAFIIGYYDDVTSSIGGITNLDGSGSIGGNVYTVRIANDSIYSEGNAIESEMDTNGMFENGWIKII